jgi:SAM-dependent methyltransferase
MDTVADPGRRDSWTSGTAYEGYIGRWSRLVAREFLPWLGIGRDRRWLDVGCGTGVLTREILASMDPVEVVGVDPSEGFLDHARAQTPDHRVRFEPADARALPFEDGVFDAVVAGLVLNFVPEPAAGVGEMTRVTRPGGRVGAYVWDYADRMELLRTFRDVAIDLDPAARDLDEGNRFPICSRDGLHAAFATADLDDVETRAIEVPTHFRDFDDLWSPFLGGSGPGPAYVAALSPKDRDSLRERLRQRLAAGSDGSISLVARAWAARGSCPS